MRAGTTLLLAVLVGCTGVIGEPGEIIGDDPPRPRLPDTIDPDNPTPPPVPAVPSVAETPVAILNPSELRNTIEDLFGAAAVEDLPLATTVEGTSLLPVTAVDAVTRFNLAETVTNRVYSTPVVMLCTPTDPSENESCTRQIVTDVGLRVYRRPLTTAEVERYVAEALTAPSFDEGIAVVVFAMLASPNFLYRIARGDDAARVGDVRPLTNYEAASQLSYTLWQTMPDDELFAAAAAGELSDEDGVRAQARRMLEHPRARDVVVRFHTWWLHLMDAENLFRDPTQYPDFDETTTAMWIDETESFVERVVFDSEGTLEELFTASSREDLSPESSAGLLSQPSFLAIHAPDERTASIYRGAFLYRNILCGALPDPPPMVPPIPEADPSASLREQISHATAEEPCVGCHVHFNDLGFALGNYDAIGAYQSEDDNGVAVDAAATLAGPGDLAGVEVANPAELGAAIASSGAARDCYVDTWLRYLLGRDADPDTDGYSRLSAQYEFEVEGRDIRELLVTLASSHAFRFTAVPAD